MSEIQIKVRNSHKTKDKKRKLIIIVDERGRYLKRESTLLERMEKSTDPALKGRGL